MIVVSDTSPLNYLVLIQQEHVLPSLFSRVVAPPAVVRELGHPAAPSAARLWAASPPSWLEILVPSFVDESLSLGLGETEAISLARELQADRLLLDERKAFLVARQLGLTVTGTLGVLNLAAEKGLLSLPEAIAALRQTTFRCPDAVIEELLRRDEQRRSEADHSDK